MAGKKTKRTVRDFKNHLLQQIGGKAHFDFTKRSDDHRAFWSKLNRLGARNMEKQRPETVPDIDATVMLSDKEWGELDRELQQLLKAC